MSSDNQALIDSLGSDTVLWKSSTDEKAKPSDVLSNKLVLLYFSAHWCPPCQRFTPILADVYRKLKARDGIEDFEIVFCSMDRVEREYKSYSGTMPWWSMPFQSPVLDRLASQYGAEGIPHLVVLDKDGSVIQKDGVGEVSMDQEGTNFPWRPKRLTELMPEYYVDSDKKTMVPFADLNDKYLLLYFSAHWCPPCKAFTPKLSKAYTEMKKARTDFELVFVSSDRSQSAFDEYFGEMSFCAMPFDEREAKTALSQRLGVQGIPSLIMLGPVEGNDRPIVNETVRPIIESGDYLTEFPFKPKPYGDLNFASDDINKFRCVVVFHEGGDDDEQEDIMEALKMVAENSTETDLHYLWALAPTGLAKAVRDALKLGPVREDPVMALLDIPDAGSFYVSSETDISIDSINKFLASPGEKKKLSG